MVGSNAISAEYQYNIRVTVADSSGSSVVSRNVNGKVFSIDFKAGGTGVAFGKAAELDNCVEINFQRLKVGDSFDLNG